MKYTPECPYCGRFIAPPRTTRTEFGEVLSGACECGAVYVCDPTGRNEGESYMEALALARGDWDIGLLEQDGDYQTNDMDYDLRTHQRVYIKGRGVKAGKLVFVKLMKHGVKETAPVKKEAEEDSSRAEKSGSERKSKKLIKKLLETGAFEEIAEISLQDKGAIRWLISLTYDKEDVLSWRAMEALGLVARKFSGERTGIIRETVRKLLWSMSDESGGIGWSAAEMLGEIIRNRPDEFSDIVPIVWSFREEEMFRPGAVWAMGRIASARPDLVLFILGDLPAMLGDANPAVRGYAAWVAGLLGDGDLLSGTKKLLNDEGPVPFYSNGELLKKTVREIAAEAVNPPSGR